MQREDPTLAFLTGGGELSGLIRALDWIGATQASALSPGGPRI